MARLRPPLPLRRVHGVAHPTRTDRPHAPKEGHQQPLSPSRHRYGIVATTRRAERDELHHPTGLNPRPKRCARPASRQPGDKAEQDGPPVPHSGRRRRFHTDRAMSRPPACVTKPGRSRPYAGSRKQELSRTPRGAAQRSRGSIAVALEDSSFDALVRGPVRLPWPRHGLGIPRLVYAGPRGRHQSGGPPLVAARARRPTRPAATVRKTRSGSKTQLSANAGSSSTTTSTCSAPETCNASAAPTERLVVRGNNESGTGHPAASSWSLKPVEHNQEARGEVVALQEWSSATFQVWIAHGPSAPMTVRNK